MIEAGGLIKLHYHDHLDVLEALTDVAGILYYKESPLFSNIQISQVAHNHLTKKEDGLFVNGTFLDRFGYDSISDELLFDSRIVSRKYTETQIKNMVDSIWSGQSNVYGTITKINAIDFSS